MALIRESPHRVHSDGAAAARNRPVIVSRASCCFGDQSAKAQEIGKEVSKPYLTLPNETNNFLRLGFQAMIAKMGGSAPFCRCNRRLGRFLLK